MQNLIAAQLELDLNSSMSLLAGCLVQSSGLNHQLLLIDPYNMDISWRAQNELGILPKLIINQSDTNIIYYEFRAIDYLYNLSSQQDPKFIGNDFDDSSLEELKQIIGQLNSNFKIIFNEHFRRSNYLKSDAQIGWQAQQIALLIDYLSANFMNNFNDTLQNFEISLPNLLLCFSLQPILREPFYTTPDLQKLAIFKWQSNFLTEHPQFEIEVIKNNVLNQAKLDNKLNDNVALAFFDY